MSCAILLPFCELMAQDEEVYTIMYKYESRGHCQQCEVNMCTSSSLSGIQIRLGRIVFREQSVEAVIMQI